MKCKPFGSSGPPVSVIGQGTWKLPVRGVAARAASESLRRGIELGMTHIDTAEMYGDGSVEELVADVITGIPREQLFIVSKVLPSHASFTGTVRACEGSLRRLRTDYLDCYLLHWRGNVAIEETMSALERLAQDGKIRSLGVSNFGVGDMEIARASLRKYAIACNQVSYSLGDREPERDVIPYCREHGIAFVAYSPFGEGDVPSPRSARGRVLAEIAARHGATAHQVILSFLTRHKPVFAIPKAARLAHVEENAGAVNVALTKTDVADIDAAFRVAR